MAAGTRQGDVFGYPASLQVQHLVEMAGDDILHTVSPRQAMKREVGISGHCVEDPATDGAEM